MGFLGKLKNILFEDDEEDEIGGMPVYTKEEVKETPKRAEVKVEEVSVPEPIRAAENTRFRNVKRDIDLNFDESDVLGEVPGHQDIVTHEKNNDEESMDLPIRKEEKKSPFLSFDEDEFERLNSRVNRNENRVKKEVRSVGMPVTNSVSTARKANNNFSSTSTNKDTRLDNNDRYKINSGTLGSGKKPFTPSPVISPVYGILDKNYKKDDIVDKQGGMKREKIVKPVIRNEEKEEIKESPLYEVDIDSVRKKAYGELENIENTLTKIEIPIIEEDIPEEPLVKTFDDIELPIEEPSIEEQLDEKYDVSDITADMLKENNDLDKVVEEELETKQETKKSKILDELEKTSTLQILDDIEKELNSIRPISKKEEEVDEEELPKRNTQDDTLESDLFHLIDSMYQEGEEEEDDD